MIRVITIRFYLLLCFVPALFSDTLTIIAVGDIMMGTTYPTANLPPQQGNGVYTHVSDVLQDADLTIGNLEGTLLTGGTCTKKVKKGRVYAFRTPPEFAGSLAEAGFDFMNLANNHMNDFGYDGIASTMRALEEVGIEYGGPHGQIAHLEIDSTQIAILCFATSPNALSLLDIQTAQQHVAKEALTNAIVIVSFHGGGEGLSYMHTRDTMEYCFGAPRGNVVAFAHAMIDSGADFVWGHGPHVPRAIEVYRNRIIAYSLGNFFTWGFNVSDERGYAPILKVTVDSLGRFMYGEIVSAVQIAHRSLEIDTLNRAVASIKELSLEDFPETAPVITEQGKILKIDQTRYYREPY